MEKGTTKVMQRETSSSVSMMRSLPLRVWLIIAVGFFERLSFYAASSPMQNYIQYLPSDAPHGVLGLGQSTATAIMSASMIYMNVTPLIGGILADNHFGRYITLLGSMCLYVVSTLILVFINIPTEYAGRGGAACFGISLLLRGMAAGGSRATISAFLGDQFPESSLQEPYDITQVNNAELETIPKTTRSELENRKNAEVSYKRTIEYIYAVNYWVINVASTSGIASTWIEKKLGFGYAFLLALCAAVIGVILLLLSKSLLIIPQPTRSILLPAVKISWSMIRQKFSRHSSRHQTEEFSDDQIEQVRSLYSACRIFVAFIFAWLCLNQTVNNLISQAGQMDTHGIPNDMMPAINTLSVIILMPLVQHLLYPLLDKFKVSFGAILKITFGFFVLASSLGYTAWLQARIYSAGPCYQYPLRCFTADGVVVPNEVNIAFQIPIHVLQAISEIFSLVCGTQYVYVRSPANLKAVAQAVFQLSAAGGAALNIAISTPTQDPYWTTAYATMALIMGLVAALFWLAFRNEDRPKSEPEQVRDVEA